MATQRAADSLLKSQTTGQTINIFVISFKALKLELWEVYKDKKLKKSSEVDWP